MWEYLTGSDDPEDDDVLDDADDDGDEDDDDEAWLPSYEELEDDARDVAGAVMAAVDEVTPDLPDVPASGWEWAEQKADDLLSYVPGGLALGAVMGLGSVATATIIGAGLLGGTLYLTGYSPNVRRAIRAFDPAESIRAANPFGGKGR